MGGDQASGAAHDLDDDLFGGGGQKKISSAIFKLEKEAERRRRSIGIFEASTGGEEGDGEQEGIHGTAGQTGLEEDQRITTHSGIEVHGQRRWMEEVLGPGPL